jgi:LacI family transcriptional regulator
MNVTQKHVAGRLGLSQRAVAFALNDSPHAHRQLRPETRLRIQETARAMGYVPHRAARRLARERGDRRVASFEQVGMISFVSAGDRMDPVRQALTDGAESELSKLSASLTLLRISQPGDWEKVERLTRAGSIDAWLLYGPVDDAALAHLTANGSLPYVILGEHRCSRPVHSVNVDNVAVGRLAVEHLAGLGHRRIGFYAGDPQLGYQRNALEGFRAALKEQGIAESANSIHFETGDQPFIEWLTQAGVTALFALETSGAAEVHAALKQSKIRVPDDLNLLACEPDASAARSQRFSRVELPIDEIGIRGAALLHRLVAQPDLPPQPVLIAPTLVPGWSTAPLTDSSPDDSSSHIRREGK